MADEGKKEFIEPKLEKSEKPLDDVTRGTLPIIGDGSVYPT
jgi:hypothetical protein